MVKCTFTSIRRAKDFINHFRDLTKKIQGSRRFRHGSFFFRATFFFLHSCYKFGAQPSKRKKSSRAYVYVRVSNQLYISFYFSFISFLSKERFRKKCPFLRNFGKEMPINSERMAISSEEIRIVGEEKVQSSEETPFNGERMAINGETIPTIEKPSEDARLSV